MAGDPFTDVSIQNYNSNPPPDDGSAVDANEITWSKHKTKIGDPLKTAIEALNTNIGGAIDKVAGGITSVADDYTIQSSDQGKLVIQTVASKTITTAVSATVTAPFRHGVLNASSGDLTLEGAGSETIDGDANITIPAGRGVILETDGSNWKTHGQNWPESIVAPYPMFAPTGRLTLTTATPVLTSSVTAQATVYYTPYVGSAIMLYDGSAWRAYNYAELSQALSDDTKSPAASLADSNYDMFVWRDGTTMRCTRGPAWTSATARGTGAGTSELVRVNGVWMNANDISNGPSAQRGVYVGTIRTNGSNQVDMMVGAPAAAAGGTDNRLYLWNAYNRVDVAAVSRDSTNSWAYTTATWRAANGNNANRISFVRGLDEEVINATYRVASSNTTASVIRYSAVGLDSTSAIAGGSSPGVCSTDNQNHNISDAAIIAAGIGLHYLQALEYSNATGATTWYGDNNVPTENQMALIARFRM